MLDVTNRAQIFGRVENLLDKISGVLRLRGAGPRSLWRRAPEDLTSMRQGGVCR